MKTRLFLLFVSTVTALLLARVQFAVGDSRVPPVDDRVKSALEALGAAVETNDKAQTVTVRFTRPILREALVHLTKIQALEGIALPKTAAPADDLAALKELPGVKKLWLDSEHVSAKGIAVLAELPRLE